MVEQLESREKELPKRTRETVWVDDKGVVVRGERKSFEAEAADPKSTVRFEVKAGKLEIDGDKDDPADLAGGAFVPDPLIAILVLPESKGKTYKFTAFYGDLSPVTIEDLGKEKVRGRSGEVEARKLVLRDADGEVDYWLDDAHRILVVRPRKLPDLVSIAGTKDESRADWSARPEDEADLAAKKLLEAAGSPGALAGELTFSAYAKEESDESQKLALRCVHKVTLAKEEKDGAVFHYTTLATIESSTATEDWWLAKDGTPVRAKYSGEDGSAEATIEGGKIAVHAVETSGKRGKKERTLSFDLPPRFVPDAILLLRALAKEEKGSFRFGSFDFAEHVPLSYFLKIVGPETLETGKGQVKTKRVLLQENGIEADCWIDETGEPLLVRWSDGEIYAVGPARNPKDLPRPTVEPKKDE